MPRHRRHRLQHEADSSFWIGYTDLLSNSLFLLLLTVAVTALMRASNEEPTMIPLTEKDHFVFERSLYTPSPSFIAALDRRIPEIKQKIAQYGIRSIEVIGHTDGSAYQAAEAGNLDARLPGATLNVPPSGYNASSNADLGLLRAIAVAHLLKSRLDSDGSKKLIFRPYSAAGLISPAKPWPFDPSHGDRLDRRRIELRLTNDSSN